MVKVDLKTDTLAVLIGGLYCIYHNINSIAVPENVYVSIAEKLELFLPNWNYDNISFEEWVEKCLTIIPKDIVTEDDLKYLQENTLYYEMNNGGVILVVSMDIGGINE